MKYLQQYKFTAIINDAKGDNCTQFVIINILSIYIYIYI